MRKLSQAILEGGLRECQIREGERKTRSARKTGSGRKGANIGEAKPR